MNGTDQLGLFDEGPKPLSAYTLRDWDWQDCRNARLAWNAATPDERLAWCKRWKLNIDAIHRSMPL